MRLPRHIPDIFLRAADALAVVPGRCLVYEDSDEGIAAARAAGLPVIDVRPLIRAGRRGSGLNR